MKDPKWFYRCDKEGVTRHMDKLPLKVRPEDISKINEMKLHVPCELCGDTHTVYLEEQK
jgi:hypothetical protein